jgi:hypothetical protein
LNGHAIDGPLVFTVRGVGGHDAIAINAMGVNIAAGALFGTFVNDNLFPTAPSGTVYFVMNWSGVKNGDFRVQCDGRAYSDVAFGLTADFLGSPSLVALPGHFSGRGFGSRPGDLYFTGGPDDNDLAMLLYGGLLHPTGDLYGGTGMNFANHTANVNTHGAFIQNKIAS